jgi:ornithine cyclodeaminase
MRAINAATVAKIYSHEAAISDCLKSLGIVHAKTFTAPLRATVSTPSQDLLLMPSAVQSESGTTLTVKMLNIVPANPGRGLPFIVGKCCLFDDVTGKLLSLIDGFMVTVKRTGAVAGASSRLLHPAPVTNIVLFGCGTQGRAGIDSLLYAHPETKRITCFSFSPVSAQRFVEEQIAKNDGREYVVGHNTEAAVREADIIHCATTSKEALFSGIWVKPGAHISAIGAYKLDMRELPNDLFARRDVRVFVDEYEAMRSEAGDVIDAIQSGAIKEDSVLLFGGIVNRAYDGRQNEEQITVVKTVGVAVQDTIAIATIYRLATEQNVGDLVDI